MRISDWSSDVCSSDLREEYTSIKRRRDGRTEIVTHAAYTGAWSVTMDVGFAPSHRAKDAEAKTGRATCRERVCQYVSISVVAVSLNKKCKRMTCLVQQLIYRSLMDDSSQLMQS